MTTTRDLDSRELNSIAASLNLNYDDVAAGWWLPAEPGPILCPSIADAVRESMRLGGNDAKRATARLTVLVSSLRDIQAHAEAGERRAVFLDDAEAFATIGSAAAAALASEGQ